MQSRTNISKNKLVLILLITALAVILSWIAIKVFTATVEDSSWNGVVATSFKSGTGSASNPYVISSSSEFAYFKQLMEGNSATLYASKNYEITIGLNYGDHDISINNTIPFSGTIDGKGNTIYNANITNGLFNELSNATIKNLAFNNIDYTLEDEQGGFLADSITSSTIEMVVIDSKIVKGNDEYIVSGITNSSTSSTYNKVIVYNKYQDTYGTNTTYNIVHLSNSDSFTNVLTNQNGFNNFSNANHEIKRFTVNNNNTLTYSQMADFSNTDYEIVINNTQFVLREKTTQATNPTSAEHATGREGNTIYLNNLDADFGFYSGLNYTYSSDYKLPTMVSKNIYTDTTLVKATITYSGIETNSNQTLTGTISSTENYNKIVYYDYLPVENNKVKITLIDNPFTNRPNGKGFNNWISDTVGVTLSYDLVRYERFAEITLTRNTQGTYDPITLDFHASWVDATEYGLTGNNWSNAFNTFKDKGLEPIEVSREECGPVMDQYYRYAVASRYSYYTGYYQSGNNWYNANNRYCNTRNGCPYYYDVPEGEVYQPGTTYYYFQNNAFHQLDTTGYQVTCETIQLVDPNFITAGYYTEKTFSRNQSINGYYNANGEPVSGTCTSSSCTYYELIQSFTSDGQRPLVDYTKKYYYLVTRDTNIAYLTGDITNYWSSSQTKPFTLTGLHNGTQTSYDWTVTNNVITLQNDTTIEHLTIYNNKNFNTNDPQPSISSGGWFGSTTYYSAINANWHNLKVGRGIKQYSTNNPTFDFIWGGSSSVSSSSSSGYYNMIIESGHFDSMAFTLPANNGSTIYADNKTVLGCDVDKVLDTNNNNLSVYYEAAASFSGTIYPKVEIATDLTVKSGKFGTSKADMYTGIYVGGLTSGTNYAARKIKVEGGYIYNLIGGPLTHEDRKQYNDSYIYMTGGEVDIIIGGAGRSPTYGNRIIQVTGGTVNYGVLGGSNGSGSDTQDGDGIVNGSSYLYIGGKAIIGSDSLINNNTTLWGVSSGSVFGNGNGKSGSEYIGSNDNSYIIIDGEAEIKGSVYGGGNYGATGVRSTASTTETKINIIGGTVNNDVYGGGNQNGSGSTSKSSTITINQTGGTVKGSIYGGSNVSGTIYGVTNVNVLDGTVDTNVYGGGKGQNTFVRNNSNVTIGSTTPNVPVINGNVYGGSGYGTVNGVNTNTQTSNANTYVTVNNGIVKGSVFGGGQGSDTYTPYVLGNITVEINGGDITAVYGGNDQAGSHNKTNRVLLNGGTIENVFGGGNKSSVNTTNVTLQGSEVANIYGGSNNTGTVQTSNVQINSGTVGNTLGGNNKGGNCYTTNVNVEGSANVLVAVYGGGNEVDTTTANVSLVSAGSTIPNVYGGGNSASVNTVQITKNNTNVTNLFGGSNSSGTVQQNYINHNGGTTTNLYGGNNEGGSTLSSNIYYSNGNTTTIYGGGNKASTQTANVNIYGGTIDTVFGGGNSAGVNNTTINASGATINNIYGGSNASGLVQTTTINSNTNVHNIYGGGNLAETNTPTINVTAGTVDYIYGGGNLAKVNNDTTIRIQNATVNNNIYGGGNFGVVKGSTDLRVTNTTVKGSIYGGGNGESATVEGNTLVNVGGNTIVGTTESVAPHSGSVFGGGNQAYTGTVTRNDSTTTVNIAGATIYGNVYGGANTSVVYGDTNVNIGYDKVTDNTLPKGDIYIKGHVFGGGEANAAGSENYDWYFISVTQGTNINIDANGHTSFDILGSFYGGGNASSATGDTILNIDNYGYSQHPKVNVSIQRVTTVNINNSSIALKGAIDRANDYDKELFAISRVITLNLKNNSELYFATGTNLLENFNSLDASNNPAVVTIDSETHQITKSVDNRLYAYEGKNINIAHDQQVTDYGNVTGMTFFGLFTFNYDDSVYTGNYSPNYNYDDTLSYAGAFTRGSYVLGAHKTNHNIEVDGFYSNFMNEETQLNEIKYIDPTPTDALFYMWFIGENVIEYNVNLVASKYSTLGSVEVSFFEFTDPNTSFEILNFDSTELADGINLVNKNDIPRTASTEAEANSNFGLTMEASNTGWLTTGKTSFYTANPNMVGTTYYEGENSTLVPTMLFYLYHSKNISLEQELGTVRISVMTITKKSALQSEVKRLVINVKMSTALFQSVEYEGAMTPGDKYELFASTTNNITTKSKLSAYYSLYGENTNLYKPGYHRVLTSTYILPLNTKITMIDFANDQNNYYYHIIDSNDVARTTTEYQNQNEVSYPLSIFTAMGSLDTNNNYSDAAMNSIYYDGTDSAEEFIFILDFSDTEITSDQLNNKLLIEIRDSNEESMITVLGIEHNQLTYNLYHNRDSRINVNVTPSDNPLYIGYSDIFDLSINYQNDSLDNIGVIDTQYFNSKLGVQISIVNNEGNTISGTDLVGTYFEMDGQRYYPDVNGITHIKLSEKVGNTQKWIIFNTENSSIATGDYTFVFSAFGSVDGIYYSESLPDVENLDIIIINSKYGLNPEINDNSIIFNAINDKSLKFTIDYSSMLDNPNIRVALYRRKYDQIYDTRYDLVDLADYVDQDLFTTNNPKEYLLISNPPAHSSFNLAMKEELLTGTYRLIFRLYDNDVLIGDITRYIIIK